MDPAHLLRPEAFSHPATDLRLIETHISWVILAGEYVYKIRKPVNLGFVDFTSPADRLADCEAEVRLNRRLCPDLYLGVVYVVERDGSLAFGGPGKEVEPAVHMRRLPDAGMLPRLIERQAIDARLMRRIARQLATFHAHAATGSGVDEFGAVEAIQANWKENFDETADCAEDVLPAASGAVLRGYVDDFIAGHAAFFAERVRSGRIRDGHGDLHANSVCVQGRKIYLFDCIEFSPRFRCADVAAEVAFLAMDLDHLGRADLAHAFVDAYVRESGDADLPRLLDFYRCYRAYVRGKVLAMRARQADAGEAAGQARAYFDLAHAYAAPFERPLLLATMGLPASGKTTLAAAVAGRLGLVHVSSDLVRKRLARQAPTAHGGESFGQGLYSKEMTRRTYAAMRRDAARWLRRGQSVVLDATFGQPAERGALRRLADRTGARLVLAVCRASDAALQARLAARTQDANAVSDARPELWPALKAAFSDPTPEELTSAVDVDTEQPMSQAVTDLVQHVLRDARPE